MKEYLKSSNQGRSMELYARIMQVLAHNKRYLSPDITAKMMARELGCTSRNFSAALQIGGGMNFPTLINGLRLKEVCRRMTLQRYKDDTVEDVALGCGFKSRQTFYAAFEKQMGLTPLQWRELHTPEC